MEALAGKGMPSSDASDYMVVSGKAAAVQQDAFRYSVALACARLCRLVYDDENDIRSELERANVGAVDFFKDDEYDIFGCIAAWPDHLVVAFRGTANLRNWLLNLRIQPHPLHEYSDRVSVHTGFHTAFTTVEKQVLRVLDRHMQDKRRKIYLTGHSLGGAIATIATAYFSNRKDHDMRDYVSACYTFAAPRVGNKDFDIFVRAPLYRITRGTDLVPALPTRIFLPGFGRFHQGGDTRYFRSNAKHVVARRQPPSGLWNFARGVGSLLGMLWTGKLKPINDHSMQGYLERVRAAKYELDRIRKS